MEGIGGDDYKAFKDATWELISDTAAEKGGVTLTMIQEACQRLFKSTHGDPTKVTAEEIDKILTQIDTEG